MLLTMATLSDQHPDLNIYKANQLESTFVEIINPKKVILSLAVFISIFDFKNNYL